MINNISDTFTNKVFDFDTVLFFSCCLWFLWFLLFMSHLYTYTHAHEYRVHSHINQITTIKAEQRKWVKPTKKKWHFQALDACSSLHIFSCVYTHAVSRNGPWKWGKALWKSASASVLTTQDWWTPNLIPQTESNE